MEALKWLWSLLWVSLAAVGGLVLFFILLGLVVGMAFVAWDRAASFESWRTLHAGKVVAEAVDYTARHNIDNVAVCIYAVSCESGRARLEPVHVESVDFDALRDRIWGRRFRGECPGLTANLGLHIVPLEDRSERLQAWEEFGVWSFGTDGFGRKLSRFHGAAFSEGPWVRCTPDFHTFTRLRGQVEFASPRPE